MSLAFKSSMLQFGGTLASVGVPLKQDINEGSR